MPPLRGYCCRLLRGSSAGVNAWFHGFAPMASAPVKAIELSGESPVWGVRYFPVVDGNCVFNRKGGEQPKTNEQSVTVL